MVPAEAKHLCRKKIDKCVMEYVPSDGPEDGPGKSQTFMQKNN